MKHWIALGLMTLTTGCSSSSVVPLLEIGRDAMRAEAQRLVDETQRDRAWAEQSRAALTAAFDADLDDQDALDGPWVREATTAYVLAREAVLRHELAVEAERRQRAANLAAASRAQQQAIDLIQQRDAVLSKLGGDALNLLHKESER